MTEKGLKMAQSAAEIPHTDQEEPGAVTSASGSVKPDAQASNVPPPGYQPGQPPVPPGYNPGLDQTRQNRMQQNIGTQGIGPQNLLQTAVEWAPAPATAPTNCPPGLEYLTQVDQVLVNQQIELLELVTNFETENKFRIRNTLGQQIYFATEHSDVFQRQCCGPARAFSMSFVDNEQREVIHLERSFQCHSCYCCCGACRSIEVQSPPGSVVGYVKQNPWGLLYPKFNVLDASEQVVLKITGPLLGCNCCKDVDFTVFGADGVSEVGKITKQWGGFVKESYTDADNFSIHFPMDMDVKMKAVLMGACILIDFLFYENNHQRSNNRRGRRR